MKLPRLQKLTKFLGCPTLEWELPSYWFKEPLKRAWLIVDLMAKPWWVCLLIGKVAVGGRPFWFHGYNWHSPWKVGDFQVIFFSVTQKNHFLQVEITKCSVRKAFCNLLYRHIIYVSTLLFQYWTPGNEHIPPMEKETCHPNPAFKGGYVPFWEGTIPAKTGASTSPLVEVIWFWYNMSCEKKGVASFCRSGRIESLWRFSLNNWSSVSGWHVQHQTLPWIGLRNAVVFVWLCLTK